MATTMFTLTTDSLIGMAAAAAKDKAYFDIYAECFKCGLLNEDEFRKIASKFVTLPPRP